jgi:hypothetical protein
MRRLSVMSPAEVAYRVKQQAQAKLERLGAFAPPACVVSEVARGKPWVRALPQRLDPVKYTHAAEEILCGKFPVFSLQPAELGFPPRWNQDPKTGVMAPLVFGKSIDYRKESLVGDIKYLWEPSRHAQLVTLAQAWHLTRDRKYADGCRIMLQSWFDQCPYNLGVHWTSSLEHSMRLINWMFAWHLLGGDHSVLFEGADGQGFKDRWLTSIYQHCHFIAGHFSRFSSANNHLLGELLGLFIAGWTWPCWAETKRWRERAKDQFEAEAFKQNGSDGVNKEQANWYHQEVADMMLIAGLIGRANDDDFSQAYWDRLHAMMEYVASIMDVNGNVPNFGDADDAIITRLDPSLPDVYRSMLACGALAFKSAAFKDKAGTIDDKAVWLFGDEAIDTFSALHGPKLREPPRRSFPEAGYYVLGSDFEAAREVRIVADAGPLGYLSIAAHGHADALSFTLSAGGAELLIDPGTYAYHTQKKWRDYFRGTSAHNTVRVDHRDQSVSGGNFLWVKHARSRLLELRSSGQQDTFIAQHDGYLRLDDPVIHRRELRYERASRTLKVVDELQCRGEHDIEIFWHFGEACSVELKAGQVVARAGDCELWLQAPAGMAIDHIRGAEAPPLGWISRSFDSRLPCSVVRTATRIRGTARFETTFTLRFVEHAERVSQKTVAASAV